MRESAVRRPGSASWRGAVATTRVTIPFSPSGPVALSCRPLRGLAAAILLAAAGGSAASAQEGAGGSVTPVETPAPAGSGSYSLTVSPAGEAFLGWVEERGEGHALRFAALTRAEEAGEWADVWEEPRDIAEGFDWWVNWVDHPAVAAFGEDRLAAHWLVRHPGSAGAAYGYGIRMVYSMDGGATWQEIFSTGPHPGSAYSGFVSYAPEPGGFSAAYLAPPPGATAESDGLTLRVARFQTLGYLLADQLFDPLVCSCCPTGLAATPAGPVLVYRDREPHPDEDDLRDIAVARKIRAIWQEPGPLHEDGWRINACPTNGPAIAAAGEEVVVAWFTLAGGEPEVRVAFSGNAGAGFGEAVRVDGGDPFGSTAAALLDDGSAAVVWVERSGGRGEIRLRRVWPDGRLEAPIRVADAAPGRQAGVPQLVRLPGRDLAEDEADEEADEPDEEEETEADSEESGTAEDEIGPDPGERLLVAWRDDRVRTAVVRLAPGGSS